MRQSQSKRTSTTKSLVQSTATDAERVESSKKQSNASPVARCDVQNISRTRRSLQPNTSHALRVEDDSVDSGMNGTPIQITQTPMTLATKKRAICSLLRMSNLCERACQNQSVRQGEEKMVEEEEEEISCVVTERYLYPRGSESFVTTFRPNKTRLREGLLDRLNSGINGSITFRYKEEEMQLRFSVRKGEEVWLVGKQEIRKIRANILLRDLTLCEMLRFVPPVPRSQGMLKGFVVDIRNRQILNNMRNQAGV